MTKALAQTYTTIHTYRVFIMRVLCVGCTLSAIWYGINVYSAISHTIAASRLSAEVNALSNEVNQLGSRYISLSSAASPSTLSAYGMNPGTVSAYIPRTASLGSVALSGHEL
jgi:hypothetical protein